MLALTGALISQPVAAAAPGADLILESIVFTDTGLQLLAIGELANLRDHMPVQITLTVGVKGETICLDPNGNLVEGGGTVLTVTGGKATIQPSEIVDGINQFAVLTDLPGKSLEIPGAPDCPPGNFTQVFTEIGFLDPTITFKQAGQKLVLECTSTQTSEDGVIFGLSCTEA